MVLSWRWINKPLGKSVWLSVYNVLNSAVGAIKDGLGLMTTWRSLRYCLLAGRSKAENLVATGYRLCRRPKIKRSIQITRNSLSEMETTENSGKICSRCVHSRWSTELLMELVSRQPFKEELGPEEWVLWNLQILPKARSKRSSNHEELKSGSIHSQKW